LVVGLWIAIQSASPSSSSPVSKGVNAHRASSTTTTTPKSGEKRKSDEHDDIDLADIEIPYDATLDSADVVRRKIHTFIESGEMKVGEFCDILGVSTNSYYRFLALHGRDKGMQSDCYIEAWKFFEKRKAAGLKMPSKKRKSTESATTKKDKETGVLASKKSKGAEDVDLSDVHLDGETEDAVEVSWALFSH